LGCGALGIHVLDGVQIHPQQGVLLRESNPLKGLVPVTMQPVCVCSCVYCLLMADFYYMNIHKCHYCSNFFTVRTTDVRSRFGRTYSWPLFISLLNSATEVPTTGTNCLIFVALHNVKPTRAS